MMGLTKVQAQTFDFISGCIRLNGRAPTREETAKALGIASKGRVNLIVDALVEKGYLARLPKRARSLEVIQHNCPNCGHNLNSAPAPRADALAVDNAAPSRHDSERQHIAVVR